MEQENANLPSRYKPDPGSKKPSVPTNPILLDDFKLLPKSYEETHYGGRSLWVKVT